MIPYLGDFVEDDIVYIMFNTFSSDDPSASVTITNFINTDVHIHKDDGLAQRNNAAGITVSVNFDGITGSHMIKIDTSDDTVGGFWVTGSDYFVRIEGTTIDGATINAVVGHFSIQNRYTRGTDSAALAATALTDATWTDARAGYLNELAAANLPSDIDTLLTRVTAAVALASICTEARLAELDAANLPTDIANVKAETALIVADTNELQTDWKDGGRLDNLLDACALEATVAALNNISTANLATALTDIKLDHLVAVADGDDPVNGSIIAMLAASDGDWSGFDIASDSLEAIRDRGDAAWTTGAGGTVPSLLQDTTIATLASQVSFTLTAGSVDDNAYNGAIIVITDAVSGVQKAVGRILDYTGASKTVTLQEDPAIFTMAIGDAVDIIATDKLFIEYTNARAGYLDELAAANIPMDLTHVLSRLTIARAIYLDSIPNIVADTNELQTDWTDGGRLDLILDSILQDTGTDGVLIAATATSAQLVDDVWDELLTGATHNIATSAGRRVREIGAYAIHSGTAQAGNSVHITLSATASATDGIYNRNLIVIVGATGAGQTRTIVDYVGATKVALVDREWRIQPDNTSEYQIVPDDTPLVVDHGLARAGTLSTITLRTYASATDNVYNGSIIAIIAGTGRGESRIVDAYNGGTKVATVCDDWTIAPDVTSIYVMMPYGMAAVVCIGADPLADIKTQADDALSDVHLDDLIQLALTVNDGAPNAADFITSSAIATDDWYNGVVLLFTSGTLAGLARRVDDYDGATKRIYVENAFPQAPVNTDAFVIVGIEGASVSAAAVADAVWDELEAGHTLAGSFGEEVTKHGKKLDRNLVLDL